MAALNRADKFTKLFKVLRRHFEPILPPTNRTLLENLLYACCLENSKYDAADEAFARLQHDFFDWNEIRVTTTRELADLMTGLFDPNDAATRLKRTLHSMFETHYSFEIDSLKKENLGKAIQHIGKFNGISPFVVGYVTQTSLGGHSIAVDRALLALMQMLDLVTDKDIAHSQIPGLERAIPKNKGAEFFSLAHQLSAALFASPFNNELRNMVIEVDSEARNRFPKRGAKRPAEAAPPTEPAQVPPKKGKHLPDAAAAQSKKPARVDSKKKPIPARKPLPKTPSRAALPPSHKIKKKPVKESSPGKQLTRKKPR